jgi:hypothetical protein
MATHTKVRRRRRVIVIYNFKKKSRAAVNYGDGDFYTTHFRTYVLQSKNIYVSTYTHIFGFY